VRLRVLSWGSKANPTSGAGMWEGGVEHVLEHVSPEVDLLVELSQVKGIC
jgi:hypothetical protein